MKMQKKAKMQEDEYKREDAGNALRILGKCECN